MKPITDKDLTLLYYGEHDDPGLPSKVAASAELSQRFADLSAELDHMDGFAPPERGDDYGADVWRRIAPKLEQDKAPFSLWLNLRSFVAQPRFSLAGAFSLVVVASLAFVLGRQASYLENPLFESPETLQSMAGTDINTARFLTASVSGHLEQVNLTFTQFANSQASSDAEAERATDMLITNRLYRQAALSRGNQQLAAFLAELEPMLIELAYEAHKKSPATRERMQQEVKDKLLFRVRVMNNQLKSPGIST